MNEVDSGLMIKDTLQGVPVNISASLIMNLVRFPCCLLIIEFSSIADGVVVSIQLFGFEANNYYRDVLIMVGFILGFGVSVIGFVWFAVRERR